MMKKNVVTMLLAVVTLVGCAQKNSYSVTCDLNPLLELMAADGVRIDSFCLADYATGEPITAMQALKDGKIAVSGQADSARLAALQLVIAVSGGHRMQRFPIFLEPGDIVATFDEQAYAASGSPLNDAYFGAQNKMIELSQTADKEEVMKSIKDYVLDHRNDLTAVMMLAAFESATADEAGVAREELALIGQCSETVQKHPIVVQITEWLTTLTSRPKEGDMFKDVSGEYKGKTTRLSDYVGRGKYVLVDFWASWCGPCRAEIPGVIALYEKYKNRNFTVIGVAVNDSPKATLQAVSDLKIPYPQILNSQTAAPEAYGFRSIPEIILFAPDGTIVARGLRGEALGKKVAALMGE